MPIFALLVAAAGWFYMFYSRAAVNLAGLEDQKLNRWRIRLRRVSGGAMFLLAIALFMGEYTFDAEERPQAFMLAWLAALLLLLMIVILALIDLRLTWRLRRRHE
ncbi:MAG: hypothetical protein ACREIT_10010 [Tepidisphaeraceae bacterium]